MLRMNELHRMQYLDALGIDQYVPRRVLPHSAPLKLCELPDAVSLAKVSLETAQAPSSESSERKLPQAADAVHRLLDNETLQSAAEVSTRVLEALSQKERSSKESSQTEKSQTENSAVDEEQGLEKVALAKETTNTFPRFSLALWQLPEGLMVIDSHEPRSALPTEKLLANILLASGLLRLNLPKAGLLSWPATTAPQADKSWQAAREYVEAYIDAAQQKQATNTLLLMGDAALVSVAGEKALAEIQLGQGFKLEQFSLSALYLPSLVTILRHPEYKALVWRALNRMTSTAL